MHRIKGHARPLRGADHLVRMARHPGALYVRPIRHDRSVVVWQPHNRFMQPVIVQTGKPWVRPSMLHPVNGPALRTPGLVKVPTIDGRYELHLSGHPECITQPETGRQCVLIEDAMAIVAVPAAHPSLDAHPSLQDVAEQLGTLGELP